MDKMDWRFEDISGIQARVPLSSHAWGLLGRFLHLIFFTVQGRRLWPCTWIKVASTGSQGMPLKVLKLCTSLHRPTLLTVMAPWGGSMRSRYQLEQSRYGLRMDVRRRLLKQYHCRQTFWKWVNIYVFWHHIRGAHNIHYQLLQLMLSRNIISIILGWIYGHAFICWIILTMVMALLSKTLCLLWKFSCVDDGQALRLWKDKSLSWGHELSKLELLMPNSVIFWPPVSFLPSFSSFEFQMGKLMLGLMSLFRVAQQYPNRE